MIQLSIRHREFLNRSCIYLTDSNRLFPLLQGELVWFDPGVGHVLPGEVLEYHRAANVLSVQAVIAGKVWSYRCPFASNKCVESEWTFPSSFTNGKRTLDQISRMTHKRPRAMIFPRSVATKLFHHRKTNLISFNSTSTRYSNLHTPVTTQH